MKELDRYLLCNVYKTRPRFPVPFCGICQKCTNTANSKNLIFDNKCMMPSGQDQKKRFSYEIMKSALIYKISMQRKKLIDIWNHFWVIKCPKLAWSCESIFFGEMTLQLVRALRFYHLKTFSPIIDFRETVLQVTALHTIAQVSLTIYSLSWFYTAIAYAFFGLNPVSPPIQDRLHTPSSEEPLGFG